jgi:hypothetical protein
LLEEIFLALGVLVFSSFLPPFHEGTGEDFSTAGLWHEVVIEHDEFFCWNTGDRRIGSSVTRVFDGCGHILKFA